MRDADPGMISDRGESEGLRGPAGECGFGAPASGEVNQRQKENAGMGHAFADLTVCVLDGVDRVELPFERESVDGKEGPKPSTDQPLSK